MNTNKSVGAYFVTICTQDKQEIFGSVGATRGSPDVTMVLNNMGKIVKSIWESLPNHHSVELDQFQIMPNHIHMIIIIVGAGFSRPITDSHPTLGNIIAYFKYQSTKQINNIGRENPAPTEFRKIFQRNYFEHIVRNDIELNKIREYIELNPLMWERDRNNPENITK